MSEHLGKWTVRVFRVVTFIWYLSYFVSTVIEDWKGIYSVYGIICILFINMNFNSNPKIRNKFKIRLYWNVKLMVKVVYSGNPNIPIKRLIINFSWHSKEKKLKCYSVPPDFGLDTFFAKLSQSPTCLSCTVL